MAIKPRKGYMDKNTLVFEDATWSQGFTQIPNIILKDNELTIQARFLYTLLLSYAWNDKDKIFPGQEILSVDMGCSTDSIQRYLKELQKEGVIHIARRGQGRTNVYTLLKLQYELFPATGSEADTAPMRFQDTAPERYPMNNTKKKNTKSIENQPIVKTPEEVADVVGGENLTDYFEGKKQIRARKKYTFAPSGQVKFTKKSYEKKPYTVADGRGIR